MGRLHSSPLPFVSPSLCLQALFIYFPLKRLSKSMPPLSMSAATEVGCFFLFIFRGLLMKRFMQSPHLSSSFCCFSSSLSPTETFLPVCGISAFVRAGVLASLFFLFALRVASFGVIYLGFSCFVRCFRVLVRHVGCLIRRGEAVPSRAVFAQSTLMVDRSCFVSFLEIFRIVLYSWGFFVFSSLAPLFGLPDFRLSGHRPWQEW